MRLGPCLRHWRAGASAQWLRQRRQHLNEVFQSSHKDSHANLLGDDGKDRYADASLEKSTWPEVMKGLAWCQQHLEDEEEDVIHVLDVGSCNNALGKQPGQRLRVTALDIRPRDPAVWQCDFLQLQVLPRGKRPLREGRQLHALPAESFDACVFSMVLHHWTQEHQRESLDKAYELLVEDGQLLVIENRAWDDNACLSHPGFALELDERVRGTRPVPERRCDEKVSQDMRLGLKSDKEMKAIQHSIASFLPTPARSPTKLSKVESERKGEGERPFSSHSPAPQVNMTSVARLACLPVPRSLPATARPLSCHTCQPSGLGLRALAVVQATSRSVPGERSVSWPALAQAQSFAPARANLVQPSPAPLSWAPRVISWVPAVPTPRLHSLGEALQLKGLFSAAQDSSSARAARAARALLHHRYPHYPRYVTSSRRVIGYSVTVRPRPVQNI
ncbi:unnamed protein product [Effrenium voratum]|nr:unnamed protein product [Effrenium voratum]